MNQQDIALTDVAVEIGRSYMSCYNAAMKGAFGEVRRDGNRLYVSRAGVAAFRALETPAVEKDAAALGGDGPTGYPDLAAIAAHFHTAGCSRIALIDHLRAERVVAQESRDERRLDAIEQMLEHLPNATYERGDAGNWTVTIPGLGSQTSIPTTRPGGTS